MRSPLASTLPRRAIGLLAAVTLLSACAHEESPHGDYGGDRGRYGGVGATLNLFISPSGKPYRAGAAAAYPISAWFAEADADHDGRLTQAEFRADAAAFFRDLDTNHDGVIDGFEVQTYEQKIAPEILPRLEGLRAQEGMDPSLLRGGGGAGRARRGGGDPSSAPPRERVRAADKQPQGAGLYSVLNEPEPVASADIELNGQISLAEWLAKADARFKLLDTASAGYLTLAGLPHTAAQDVIERRRRRDAKRSPPHDHPPAG